MKCNFKQVWKRVVYQFKLWIIAKLVQVNGCGVFWPALRCCTHPKLVRIIFWIFLHFFISHLFHIFRWRTKKMVLKNCILVTPEIWLTPKNLTAFSGVPNFQGVNQHLGVNQLKGNALNKVFSTNYLFSSEKRKTVATKYLKMGKKYFTSFWVCAAPESRSKYTTG